MTLRVTLEIIPHGIEDAKQTLHTLEIHNTGTRTGAGETLYAVDLNGERVKDRCFLHDRKDGALALVERVLKKLPAHLLYQNKEAS